MDYDIDTIRECDRALVMIGGCLNAARYEIIVMLSKNQFFKSDKDIKTIQELEESITSNMKTIELLYEQVTAVKKELDLPPDFDKY